MGSETTTLCLPVIDFSNEDLKPGSGEWETVKSQVFKALVEFGCFEASFNKSLPADLKMGFFNSMEELFQLPLETKQKYVSEKVFHGYYKDPTHECMSVDEANIPRNVDSFTSALWPLGNSNISEMVHSFIEILWELNQTVRRMVLESLGLEKYMEEHMKSTNYVMRAMKYQGNQTPEAKLGLHPHTDKNFMTILYQNQIDGLEVKTKNGEWIPCKLSPDSFIVLIGDSYNAWTNGRLYSPFHRVTMRGNEARYSAGLFCNPKQGHLVKAPEELVDEEHPLLFKPYDFMEFLGFLRTEAGQKCQSALHTYCGL